MWPIIVVLALVAAGCGGSSPELDNDADVDDIDSGDGSDIDVDGDSDTDIPTDTETDPDTGTSTDTGTDSDTTPDAPFAPGSSVYSDAPCAFPASITHQATENRLYVTCGGMTNALWKSPVLGTTGDWTDAGQVPGYPSNHIMIDNQYAIVGHSMPDGFTIVDYTSGVATQSVDFSAITILDSTDTPLTFTPNYPAGILVAGGKIFVATNNIDVPDYTDPALTTFHPGTVIHFDYNGDGTADTSSASAHMTSGLNPTGMVEIDGSTFAVLSSGTYDPTTSEAAMEICDVASLACTAVDLGDVTGQASPFMPITEGGLLLAGIQRPNNKLMGVDSSAGIIEFDNDLLDEYDDPLVEGFISNVCAYGDVAIMSDFGEFGVGGGQILFANTDPWGWTEILQTPIVWGTGALAGPAVVVGDTLYATVTKDDGSEGRIYDVNVSAMD